MTRYMLTTNNTQVSKTASRRRRGQGLTEYVIIVGLVAVGLIVAVGKFKEALKGGFDKSATTITTQVTDQIGK